MEGIRVDEKLTEARDGRSLRRSEGIKRMRLNRPFSEPHA